MALKKTVNHHKKKHCRKPRRSSSSGHHSSGGGAPPQAAPAVDSLSPCMATDFAATPPAPGSSSATAGAIASQAKKIIAAGKAWVADHAGFTLYTGATATAIVAAVAVVALSTVARRRH